MKISIRFSELAIHFPRCLRHLQTALHPSSAFFLFFSSRMMKLNHKTNSTTNSPKLFVEIADISYETKKSIENGVLKLLRLVLLFQQQKSKPQRNRK
jgi:hypothetical protein